MGRRIWAVEMEIIDADGIEPDHALDFADRDQIERGFRSLDPDQRTVIVLHYYLGLSLDDVGDALGTRRARSGLVYTAPHGRCGPRSTWQRNAP